MHVTDFTPGTYNALWLAIMMVDSLAEVGPHPTIPMAYRIRPSHPRYFDAIYAAADNARCMGVALIMVREVEVSMPEPLPVPPRAPGWHDVVALALRVLKVSK